MDATDMRDQDSDAEATGVPEATSSTEATSAAQATSNAEAAGVAQDTSAAEETSLADLLTDLGKAAQETAATLSEKAGDGEAAVRAGLEEAESTIRQHPLLAVGIAAGVGFMLGLLLRGSGAGQSDDG